MFGCIHYSCTIILTSYFLYTQVMLITPSKISQSHPLEENSPNPYVKLFGKPLLGLLEEFSLEGKETIFS